MANMRAGLLTVRAINKSRSPSVPRGPPWTWEIAQELLRSTSGFRDNVLVGSSLARWLVCCLRFCVYGPA